MSSYTVANHGGGSDSAESNGRGGGGHGHSREIQRLIRAILWFELLASLRDEKDSTDRLFRIVRHCLYAGGQIAKVALAWWRSLAAVNPTGHIETH